MNKAEPKPEVVGSLVPPAWLDRDAAATWNELAPELARLHLLTVIDVQALAGACRWWAVYRKADRELKRGLITDTPSNGKQPKPHFAIAQKAFASAMAVFSRFGITPSERVRLETPAPKGAGDETPKSEDRFDTFLRKRNARQRPPIE